MLRDSRKEVVIKVLKPGVEDTLATDLDFLYLASRQVTGPSFCIKQACSKLMQICSIYAVKNWWLLSCPVILVCVKLSGAWC